MLFCFQLGNEWSVKVCKLKKEKNKLPREYPLPCLSAKALHSSESNGDSLEGDQYTN